MSENNIIKSKVPKKEKRKYENKEDEQDDMEIKQSKKSKKNKHGDRESSNDVKHYEVIDDDKTTAVVEDEEDEKTEEERKRRKAEKKTRKAAKKAAKLAKLQLSSSLTEGHRNYSILNEVISPPVKAFNSSFGPYSHYVEDNNVITMTTEEVRLFREEQGIQVSSEEDSMLFKPLKSFDYLSSSLQSYCPYVNNYFANKKFKTPSAVQAQCWPPLLAGRDVIGIAMTGSGKTLAFLIPGMLMLEISPISKSLQQRPTPSPRMLILAPTRELAMQSFQVIEEMQGLKGICLYGGASKETQISQLRAGVDIIVATPGRLVDFIESRIVSLQHVIYSVLDEADRMLDEGFIPSVRQILSACPPKRENSGSKSSLITTRQTVMFSATWPEEIRTLAETFMSADAVRVTVGSAELSANHRVTQIVEVLADTSYPLRDRKLIELLTKYHKSRTNRCLIFVLYKKEAVTLQRQLENKGYKVTSIHGDKSQNERFAALNEFKDGSTPLLIATDVAARGLDIPQVEYVINYSFPLTVEDYVHRIGRTGRGGNTGISHTFFTDNDKGLAAGLVGVLQEANQVIPQEIYRFPMFTKKKPSNVYGNFGPKIELQGSKPKKITFDD